MDAKIIHIVLGKANPNKMNGVNKVVNELASYQTNLGYDVTLWGITKSLTHNYPERNYKTVLFFDSGKFKICTSFIQQLKSLPKNTVFHIHGGFIPQFYFVAKGIVSAGFKYVFTPHGAYNKKALMRSRLKKIFFLKTFDKYIIEHAKCLHFIGQSEVDHGLHLFGNIPYSLIPNGQPILTQIDKNNSQNETKELVFGFMGRIDIDTKGLDLLFEGFCKYIVNQKLKGKLLIIGDGPEMSNLKNMAQNLGIIDAVVFTGSLYGKEKEMALKEIDVFCLTSRNEGLPGVVLEAASYHVPAIVSHETNMGAYISKYNAGWVLRENNALEIAHQMTNANVAFQEKTIEVKRQNVYSMLVEEFDWTRIAKMHLKNYEA